MNSINRRYQKGVRCESAGASLIELLIAMALILVISALAVPAWQAIRYARLREAGSDYASLLQSARISAVQNDSYYPVVVSAGPPVQAFVDMKGTGVYASGDAIITLPNNIYARTYASNPPGLANLEAQALTSSTDPSLDTTDNPTFGPRGLPCKPTTSGGYTTCPSFSGTVSGTSYISFFQSQPDGTWLAVVVNPASRIKVFTYSSSSWMLAQ